jgi:hypothetical protein
VMYLKQYSSKLNENGHPYLYGYRADGKQCIWIMYWAQTYPVNPRQTGSVPAQYRIQMS